MTKKEKGKFNPFVRVLRPGEEILWLHSGPITMSQHMEEKEKGETGQAMANILSLIFLGLIVFFIQRQDTTGVILSALSCVAFVILFWIGLATLRRSVGAYAVTNKRLLHYIPNKISVLALEDLDVCYESDGTLSFNILYPTWHNVPDADAVLRLIKKAAENRASELQERHFDERKREGQA